MPLKLLMQDKIGKPAGANCEHKHSEIKLFSTLNK